MNRHICILSTTVFLFLCYFRATHAVSCYVCNTIKNIPCLDTNTIPCSLPVIGDKVTNVCIKIVAKSKADASVVIKGCSIKLDDKNTCDVVAGTMAGSEELTDIKCTECTTDGCNAGTDLGPKIFLVGILMAFLYISYLM